MSTTAILLNVRECRSRGSLALLKGVKELRVFFYSIRPICINFGTNVPHVLMERFRVF
jgi:hypothetical protein